MALPRRSVLVAALLARVGEGKVFFQESFDDTWQERWVESTEWKEAKDMGTWKHTAGKWHGDENDKGIQTVEDAKFYGLSALMTEPFTQTGDLVLQYTVKHEQKIDCGGAYIKLAAKADQKSFSGDTPYQIMFGPDICGGTKRTHVIFHYPVKDDNLLVKKEIRPETDQKSHLYTLHLKASGEYEVFIDDKSKQTGTLEEGWDFLEPKEIKDPALSKPADWVDEKEIPDPAVVKPEGYDDIPKKIADPDAEKPEDWDDEDDGEWEAPEIDNPEYKGAWKPTMMINPEYKGEWEHPMIANPDYAPDAKLAQRCVDCGMVGFELWQVKSGTMFDDIIVADSLEEARAFAKKTFFAKADGEKDMFDQIEAERQAKEKVEREERKKQKEAEEAAKKAEEEEEEDDDEDYDDGDEDTHDEL
jgi:calreticulin